MREPLRAIQGRCSQWVRGTSGVLVAVCEPPGRCPSCDGPMQVEKTRRRHAKTIEHGQFELHETVHGCAAGCRHPSGLWITRRAGWLAEHLIPIFDR